jgi:hypothetical protein
VDGLHVVPLLAVEPRLQQQARHPDHPVQRRSNLVTVSAQINITLFNNNLIIIIIMLIIIIMCGPHVGEEVSLGLGHLVRVDFRDLEVGDVDTRSYVRRRSPSAPTRKEKQKKKTKKKQQYPYSPGTWAPLRSRPF